MREELRSSETVFRGRVITVRVDQVQLEDGAKTAREIVAHQGSVALVALDRTGRVLLVRQYRHAAGDELWELPAGRVERGEEPASAAARELAEEAGLRAGGLEQLVAFYVSPGYCTELLTVFLAVNLSPDSGAHPDPNERICPGWFPFAEAERMCLDGRIRDAKTIAGIFAARLRRCPT